MTWVKGGWMQTYTGRQFYPLAPSVDEIDVRDIAHSLAMQCRYNGHTDRFYSVAEHCVLMSEAVEPWVAKWALLHDAAEAYVGDMVRPLKQSMPDFSAAEDVILAAIAARFELDGSTFPDEVREADNRILLTERAALMSATRHRWNESLEAMEPLDVTIEALSPVAAEERYRLRFCELFGEWT